MEPTVGNVSVAALLEREIDPVYGHQAKLLIEGSTVLVTGAGGSIGSEIVRQLRLLGASKIVCVDANEYALYLLERELNGSPFLGGGTSVLADIRNQTELDAVFAAHRPQMVFHAAAYKHLALLEQFPAAAVLTNVLGTMNVVAASAAHGVHRFVNISTDKAANPSSVLGLTKRLAEIVAKLHATSDMKVASVRFGNVFASRGSFVETFVWQIANGRPVKVTDAAMERFFMTTPQAAGLVIEAAVMANGGSTFVLDMGDSYTIVDLIRRYAVLSGSPEPTIIFTGLRPGEKMGEQLFDNREVCQTTRHPAISTVLVDQGATITLQDVGLLCSSAAQGLGPSELRGELCRLIAGQIVSARTDSTVEV
jgi:FlaA1/EpsC-like NDP-sugar epimerase